MHKIMFSGYDVSRCRLPTMTKPIRHPNTPEGYQPAQLFRYPILALQIGGTIIFLISIPLFGLLGWALQGRPADVSHTFASVAELGVWFVSLIAAPFVTIVVHELIHGLAFRMFGYRVTYGIFWKLPGAYAAAFGQYQQRRHAIIVLLAPLIVLTALCVPLLAAPNALLLSVAFVALVSNTSGAVGDLYATWRLLHISPHSLLYDVDIETMFIFQPVNS
jgi:hypothetical protein